MRIDLEHSLGRIQLVVQPQQVIIRPGDGVEWDFRYLGGADVIVEDVIIEFDKPAPFSKPVFKSHNPGSARPHRQLSGPISRDTGGKTITYTIRCLNAFKNEVAIAKPSIAVM